MQKRGQISFEYMILIGFLTFVIIGVLGVAMVYSGSIKDRLRISQVNNFATKIVSTSESVFYAGEPSRATIVGHLPENVESITFSNEGEIYIMIFEVQTHSGVTQIPYTFNVPILGESDINRPGSNAGIRKIQIKAEDEGVVLSDVTGT